MLENFQLHVSLVFMIFSLCSFGVIEYLMDYKMQPCPANVHRLISRQMLRRIWVGKDVDHYIRFRRLLILHSLNFIINAALVFWVFVFAAFSENFTQCGWVIVSFVVSVVLTAIKIWHEETPAVGESLTKSEKKILLKNFLVVSIAFIAVFIVFWQWHNIWHFLWMVFIPLAILASFYLTPIISYEEKISKDGMEVMVDRVIGDTPKTSLKIELIDGKIFDSNEKFFYPIFNNSDFMYIICPDEVGVLCIRKAAVKAILYRGGDVTEKLLYEQPNTEE